VRLVCISDTHMNHDRMAVPACDVLLHCGDITRRGTRGELVAFLAWLRRQPARHKLVVAGNHDHTCEADPAGTRALVAAHGGVYLADEELTLEGRRFWGSPVTPAFRSLAFNRERGSPIRAHWDAVPAGLDVLATHGPPRGLGDRVLLGMHVGCDDLLARVLVAAPRLHVFGHIHEAFGAYRHPAVATQFLNVASQRLLVRATRAPVAVDI